MLELGGMYSEPSFCPGDHINAHGIRRNGAQAGVFISTATGKEEMSGKLHLPDNRGHP